VLESAAVANIANPLDLRAYYHDVLITQLEMK
jgi:hypothetical protein